MQLRPAYIVDDSGDYRLLLAHFLARKVPDYPVKFFDGAHALLKYLAGIQEVESRPSVIVLDVQMPEISGFEALNLLRSPTLSENGWWKKIPVIFNTSTPGEEIERKCFELGANGFLRKSVYIEGLQDLKDCVVDYAQRL